MGLNIFPHSKVSSLRFSLIVPDDPVYQFFIRFKKAKHPFCITYFYSHFHSSVFMNKFVLFIDLCSYAPFTTFFLFFCSPLTGAQRCYLTYLHISVTSYNYLPHSLCSFSVNLITTTLNHFPHSPARRGRENNFSSQPFHLMNFWHIPAPLLADSS